MEVSLHEKILSLPTLLRILVMRSAVPLGLLWIFGMDEVAMKTTQELEVAITQLEKTPAILRAWLEGLPQSILFANEGKGTWSAQEIVGHFIYGEQTDWIPRARRILEHGESKAFDPFDRNGYIAESRNKPLAELLNEFAALRAQNLTTIRGMGLNEEKLSRTGKHPALGIVTLGELLASWVVHDMTHIHQLSRVMASQYREKIGPWGAYMGVLKCNGHG